MEISIYNLKGQGIYTIDSRNEPTVVDVSKLASRLYICQIKMEDQWINKKFLK